MARFLKHIACSYCGSSDARGVYDDGSEWCFSGGVRCTPTGASISPLVAKALHGNDGEESRAAPDDTSTHIGPAGLAWLRKYHVPLEVLLQQGVRWSEKYQQLLFTFPPDKFYQARNFRQGKSKYFTSGSHEDLLPVYPLGNDVAWDGDCSERNLVIVEDCLSAISIAYARPPEGPWCEAMPLLGSHLPTAKLVRLARLYSHLIIHLDHDKGKEAFKIANRAKLLGLTAEVVVTDDDPKELLPEQLVEKYYRNT